MDKKKTQKKKQVFFWVWVDGDYWPSPIIYCMLHIIYYILYCIYKQSVVVFFCVHFISFHFISSVKIK